MADRSGLPYDGAQMPTRPWARDLLEQAWRTNTMRDVVDRAHGTPAPGDTPLFVHLRTAESALSCGLDMQNWDVVAEGLALVQEVVARLLADETHRT